MRPYLSIVIPAYNEEKNFRSGVLRPVMKYLQTVPFSWELIFVDDGSTDRTNQLLQGCVKRNKNCRLLKVEHGGKAAAVTAGMLSACGELVMFTDFDQSTPLNQVEKFISSYKNGNDVVIASRGIISSTQNDSFIRKIRGKIFTKLVQAVLLPDINDSQCGFKLFSFSAARRIFSSLVVTKSKKVNGGYMGAFDVEALFLAKKFGYKIDQVPVNWINIPSDRLNVWKEPIKMLVDIVTVRLYDLLGKYEKAGSDVGNYLIGLQEDGLINLRREFLQT